jgi:hypothetical protein
MRELEQTLLAALQELDNTVKSRPVGAPVPNLVPIFARLDQLTRQLPKDTNPDLLHFLHRKSYEKARLLLEGHGAQNERGTCR